MKLLDTIYTRRTVRSFIDKKIDKKTEKAPASLELTIVETKDEPVVTFEENKQLEQIGEDNIGKVVGEVVGPS